MIDFKKVEIEDKKWVDNILKTNNLMSTGYCFGSMFIWKDYYNIHIANLDGFLILATFDEDYKNLIFSFPCGQGDIKSVIDKLMDFSLQKKQPFKMQAVEEYGLELLNKLYPEKFNFVETLEVEDYIYLVEKLISLSGKKLHSKRNHIARFKENKWSFEEITDLNYKECIDMTIKWCEKNGCLEDESKQAEFNAIKKSFEFFRELEFFGGMLRVDGNVVAFTIGERINSDTVDVHIEKAFTEIQGAYSMIAQQFMEKMCSNYKYVNREEDLGIEGLRKSKRSYQPEFLIKKYNLTLR